MKTYVITLSQVFPSTHNRAGEPTLFKDAFNAGQVFNTGGECLYRHPKFHTIRANYQLWKKRFEQIQNGEACLSVRKWTGKPYRSPQTEIAMLTREDGIGLQKMTVIGTCTCHPIYVDGVSVPVKKLAANDGLSYEDWVEWFKGYDLTEPLAVIQFTKFRY